MKREDLLPLAFGGNKLRNLEFLVGAALAEGADTLVTSGRRWSNHCRLTAAAGARAGLDVHLVLSGPPVEPPGPGIRLARAYGATVHQLATADRGEREARVAAVVGGASRGRAAAVRRSSVGGTGAVGATGQLVAAREAFDQAAAAGVRFDAIVLPTATGGTQAGLIVGAAERVAGDARHGRGRGPSRGGAARRSSSAWRACWRLDAGADLPADAVRFDETQLGDGYGRPTSGGDRGDRAPRAHRGDPRRPDLHGQGAGGRHRRRPLRR